MSTHELSHPGIKATVSLVKQRFVWPSIDKDCREWIVRGPFYAMAGSFSD